MAEATLDFLTAPRIERSFLVLCLVLLPVAVFFAFARPWGQTADLWETAAAVRAVAQNFTRPDNPLLDLPGTTSPQFTPYTLMWGAVMSWWSLSIFTTMALAGVTNFLLFVTGIFRFVGRLSRNGILPTYMLLVMIVVWGTGYSEAGAYQMRMFFETLPYVAMFAYGLTFHALASLRKFIDHAHAADVAVYAVLMVTVFVTHPLTGLFGFVTAAAMLTAPRDWRRFALMQAVPIAAMGAAVLWPYFDYWRVLTRGAGDAWFVSPLFDHQVEALGPALAGIPIVVYYGLKRRHGFVVIGMAACLLIYAVSWATQVHPGGRFLLYAAFFMHLAIAVYFYEHGAHRRRHWEAWLSSHGYLMIIVFLVAVPGLSHRAREMNRHVQRVYDPPLKLHSYESPVEPWYFLIDELNETDIVLADDTTGWVLPALTGAKIVSQQKGDPLITAEINLRRQGVQGFLYGALSTRERVAIIRRYRVTHILLDERRSEEWNASMRRDLDLVATPQSGNGYLRLWRVVI